MKFALLIFAAALLAGCATHDQHTIASVRAAGVSPRIVAKLEHHGVLVPSDLVELRRRGVNDAIPVRQLDKDGVDYVVQRDEIRRLRSAGVRPVVTEALVTASGRFVADRYEPRGYYADYYGPPWYWWLPALAIGYAWGHDYHHHHHHGGHHHHH